MDSLGCGESKSIGILDAKAHEGFPDLLDAINIMHAIHEPLKQFIILQTREYYR